MIEQQQQLLLPRHPPEVRLDIIIPPISQSHCGRAVDLMNINPSQKNLKSDDDDDDECSQIRCGCFWAICCAITPCLIC